MPKAIDLTGIRFGMLVAVQRASPKPYTGEAVWLCKCDCGNEVEVTSGALKRGATKSCGCNKAKLLANARTTHGLSKSRLYVIWKDMKGRCERPSAINYALYGGKGISVCEEWRDFSKFAKWSFEHGYSDNLTIDRIDGEKGYCPDNCRWVSWSEQQNNRCNNHMITVRGETDTLTRMAEKYNIPWWVVSSRIRNGWDEERAVLTPKRYYPCKKSV